MERRLENYPLEKRNPVLKAKVSIQKTGIFNLSTKILDKLNIDDNYIILFRLTNNNHLFISKLTSVRKNCRDYRLAINKTTLDKMDLPLNTEIEIIDYKKIGHRPKLKGKEGYLNLVKYLDGNMTCFELEDKILVYYLSGIRNPSRITLPRFLKIDGLSCWNFGFYLAEGEKATNYRFGVSNNEYNLMKRFIDFSLNHLKLNINNFKFELRLKNYNSKAVEHWSQQLGIAISKFNTRIIKNKPPESKNGNMTITLYNVILGTLNKKIIYDLEFIKSLRKEHASALLRGVQAGDGGVLHHSGCIELTISTQKKELKIYDHLLRRLCSQPPKIRKSHTCNIVWMLYHRGTNIAREYIINDFFKEHGQRWNKLILLYKLKAKKQIAIFKAILNNNLTVKERCRELNSHYASTNIYLKRLIKEDILESKIIDSHRKTRNFHFTEKGLKIINNIGLN
ncbi:MAG: hypothetical protein ABIB47_02595 [Candidatus Woesearchaeota archaeon]